MIALHHRVSSFAISVGAELPKFVEKSMILLVLSEPAKIIETNLNVSHNIAAEAGTDLMMFCKSEGNPLPNITWFKVSRMLTNQ